MKPIIEIENLSKKFSINHAQEPYLSLRDSFKNIFNRTSKEDFYALKDINFTVEEGDSVGIIGKNGAGKSTLLKIISKITPPTTGSITYRGRVASLLEVGTGFHSELTGRENVFMNGSILGMKRNEIKKNFDAIVDFAGVEKFIDTPLKHYSSGMQLRLAFAVAAFLENEILIIDEVLAVGDAEFQKKCIGKMGEVSKSGRTLLFVSHNMVAVKNLCNQSIYLQSGALNSYGKSNDIIDAYLSNVDALRKNSWEIDKAPGTKNAKLIESSVLNESDTLFLEDEIVLSFKVKVLDELLLRKKLNFSLVLLSQDEVPVFNVASDSKLYTNNEIVARCIIPGGLLNDEHYHVRMLLVDENSNPLFDLQDVLSFKIEERKRDANWYGKWIGVIRPTQMIKWELN